MKKFFTTLLASAFALGATPLADAAKKVHTIGDSTMADYNESATVTRGWCQYLQQFFDGITVNNRGKNGASSKSFYEEAAFWKSVKSQMQEGDYVLIQFSHNDEKTQGMDGDEVKAYYTSIGDAATAAATDYRGTCPNTTYKEYLRKYVNETRAMGCTPILVGPVCRMYFSGNTIRRNGRHDLGDGFSVVTSTGIKTGQKVAATDHSMDYPYQMQEVAKELDVPYVDLTTATADLFLSYGDADCHSILGDGDGSTHLSATGATLIGRRFAQLCQEQGILTEYIRLSSELSVTPANGDMGKAYQGQTVTKEFMITGFSLTPATGKAELTCEGAVEISADGVNWASTLSLPYEGSTLLQRFQARMTISKEGENAASINVKAGDKTAVIPVVATGVELGGGVEVNAYWRLEKDDKCELTGSADVVEQNWHGMEMQKYSAPNAATTWPEWTGFDASRKTQRNVIEGQAWPAGEIDEVSTRYIEFGLKAAEGTELKIDKLSYFVCGCGGNGMCLKSYYVIDDDMGSAPLIFEMKNMPANNMQYVEASPVISLQPGQKVSVRFYPWYSSAANAKTLCISDVTIHGYASGIGQSGLADVITSSTPVNSDYYTLQGIQVTAPVEGGLYIVRDTYADGQVKCSKRIF